MLDYLSLKPDIENIDELIKQARTISVISEDQLSKLKSLAIKSAKGDRNSIKEFIELLSTFQGFSMNEYIKLISAKGNLVSKQKDLLFQSSNAILAEDLQVLLKFIISEIGEQHDIKFEDVDELSNPSYWKYKFNQHRKVTQK